MFVFCFLKSVGYVMFVLVFGKCKNYGFFVCVWDRLCKMSGEDCLMFVFVGLLGDGMIVIEVEFCVM